MSRCTNLICGAAVRQCRLPRVPGIQRCAECPDWTPDDPARGAGDLIAKLTHAVGIEPCGGCQHRQAWLNRRLPLRERP
jgi:hypothetical protein